jgi:hypothetical protein
MVIGVGLAFVTKEPFASAVRVVLSTPESLLDSFLRESQHGYQVVNEILRHIVFLGLRAGLLDTKRRLEDRIVHVFEVPHHSHVGTRVASGVESVFGTIGRHSHANNLVKQLPVEVRLSVLLLGSLLSIWQKHFSLLRSTHGPSEPFEVLGDIGGHLKLYLKLLWHPAIIYETLKDYKKDFGESVKALTLCAHCSLLATSAHKVRDMFVCEKAS